MFSFPKETAMKMKLQFAICLAAFVGAMLLVPSHSLCQEPAPDAEIRAASKKLTDAFNAGKAADLSAMFLAQGEVIDEQGNLFQGQKAVQELLTTFFEKFPGVKSETSIESIRLAGPVAIEEGVRTTVTQEGSVAQVQYTTIYSKLDQGWKVASIRDSALDSIASPGELLQPLEWLIGEWINEGADARVKLTYQWSEDGNFILGEVLVMKSEQPVMKSTQRICWDPRAGKPRSWTFDSDGGFAESVWTQIEDAWSVRSEAVLPNGETGSANVFITIGENGRYVMKGTNRIVGNIVEDDYEITVVKQPPTATK
jgi:uncharacterized protein (TIGR02246 family)